MSILLQLYLIFAKTAILTFGGGYAMIPLFCDEIVVKHAFMDGAEFANLVALAQVTPGPIGLNSATYVGMSQAGIPGAIAATLGVMTPAFVTTLAAALFLSRVSKSGWLKELLRGIRPCVLGVIAAAVVFFADTSVFTTPVSSAVHGGTFTFGVSPAGLAIFACALVVEWRWKPAPLWLLAGSAIAGILLGGW